LVVPRATIRKGGCMQQEYIQEYRRLKDSGWDVSKEPAVRFNSGSESIGHIVAKTVSAKVLIQNGWMVDTEVEHPQNGEIDVLAYAPDKINYAVELENEPTEDIKQDKLERYVYSNEGIEDMQMIDVGSLPAHCLDMRDRIITELGLY